MKGVPIKFRGKDMNGQYVYGLLTKKLVRHSGVLSYAIVNGSFKSSETIPVSEDSIAQLVGYDAEGNEVYEGDLVEKIDELAEYYDSFKKKGGKLIAALEFTFRIDWKGEPPDGRLTLQAQEENALNWIKTLKKV